MSFCFKFVSWVSFPIENLICCSISSNSKILHSDLFLIFLQLLFMFFCLRYFENFHSHWSLPVIAAFFVGIFCSSKKLRQTKRSGGVLFAAHTLLLLHHGVHLASSGGGWVPHFLQQHVSRARGKNVVFFVFLFYLFFFSVFTTARIFASSSL